jgi:hypothetical protein
LQRGGLLDEATHRLLASWAADCAEHVLGLFEVERSDDARPRQAIEAARAWAAGKCSVIQAREAAFAAHQAAKSVTGAAREAARSAGHAVAVAHMADHELGAAAYAIRAVRAASPKKRRELDGWTECEWQREQLPEAILELVLADEAERNRKFWNLFQGEES